MKCTTVHIAIALFFTITITSSFSILADPIVIDSGSDETVISRLPNAGVEEEFVCSDTSTGTLGKCQDAPKMLLGFYKVVTQFPDDTNSSQRALAQCDEGDYAVGGGVGPIFAGLPNFEIYETKPHRIDTRDWSAVVGPLAAGEDAAVFAICADFSPAHVQ